MSKLESLINRYTYIKKQWLNSEGTSEQSLWEKQMEQIVEEMKNYKKSQGIGVRTDPADKVRLLYSLYKETPENTKED